MKKKEMRKYKIAVGICGPTILYSDVIKAQNRVEAVERFIADSDGQYTESDKETLLQHIHEIVSRKSTSENANRTSMKDYDLKKVISGDPVAFICVRRNKEGYRRYSIQKGTIQGFTASSVVIDCPDLEQTFRIVETSGSYTGNRIKEDRLKKVALMKEYLPAANESEPTDALGQELKLGDVVAYMDDIYQDSCAGFIKGTVTKITAKLVEMDGFKRKTRGKVVRIESSN